MSSSCAVLERRPVCWEIDGRGPSLTWMVDGTETSPSVHYRVLGAGTAMADDEWIGRLSATGAVRDEAVTRLHELMLRATRHQIARMPEAHALGAVRRDELAHAAADEATVSALGRLHTFEGRSRFTTWAFKFGILSAGVELRRAVWRDRDVRLHDVSEPSERSSSSPEAYAEARDLATVVREGLIEALTDHQRRVAVALLVDGVPIDVLAERLGSNRNALYKTLHDVRRRLRSHMEAHGFTPEGSTKGVTR